MTSGAVRLHNTYRQTEKSVDLINNNIELNQLWLLIKLFYMLFVGEVGEMYKAH